MKRLLFATSLSFAFAWACWFQPRFFLAGRAAPLPAVASSGVSAAISPLVGVAACSGPACHGHEQDRPGARIRGNEYALWNLWDPHAQAYRSLEGPLSRDIMRHLARGGKVAEATREPRCLVCHTDSLLVAGPVQGALPGHGVGCESCHGPAERWLDAHTEKFPSALKKWEKLEPLGMKNLGRPRILAEVCAGCHVGAPEQDGRPAQEVTHDLLAAGHPRLNFELTVYLAHLPPHWHVARTNEEHGSDFEARAWAMGQVITARASLKLNAYQKRRSSQWPEFAALDCEACHTPIPAAPHTSRPGLPLSRWPVAMLAEIADQVSAPVAGTEAALRSERLRDLFRARLSKEDELVAQLNGWATALEGWKCDAGKAQLLMRKICGNASLPSVNWEEAEQGYLALSALEQVWQTRGAVEQHERIQKHLFDLAEELALPSGFSGRTEVSANRRSLLVKHLNSILRETK
ncbi:MAG TPA: multiheme c-type cytochrome [Gemmataceae bacterium]|jgi:hypothetical protein|nr:multiheme c-type cytochrome [Gemmataceae bacterium]